MASQTENRVITKSKRILMISILLVLIGIASFVLQVGSDNPQRAWQAYLINFLLWSAIAQGAVLFSTVTHITKARWGKPVQSLAESFTAFFPISFGLFLLLFLGKDQLFPWLQEDLHGKGIWLNLPFLFSRDFIGLGLLYGLGLGYLYYALRLKLAPKEPQGRVQALLHQWWSRAELDKGLCKSRMGVLAVLYIIAYAIVLSLIGFDLVMSMDPHWISTLFGAYSFVKAFYTGLGALIILAALVHLRQGERSRIMPPHFHDLGKLFFAFGLAWADFFYCQFIVIWYGNISEETSYIIQRTMMRPWNSLAWTVFVVSFVIPFFILLNRKVKTRPRFMIVLCSLVLVGIWLEHLLLLGPVLSPGVAALPLGPVDALITLGFLGLMGMAVTCFLNFFPGLFLRDEKGVP